MLRAAGWGAGVEAGALLGGCPNNLSRDSDGPKQGDSR